MNKQILYPTQKTSTYHLDQNVRGLISKDLIQLKFLDRYYPEKHEALLPFAALEYAGIDIKKIFLQILPIPKSILSSEPLNLKHIKDYFESQIKEKLPDKQITEKIKERLEYDNKYAKPFIEACMRELSKPYLYALIVNQLVWDRFSQMEWSKEIPENLIVDIRKAIAKIVVKNSHLYILRHCAYLSKILPDFSLDENQRFLMETMQKVKIKQNMDIGDCELIHVALNGQSSGNLKKKRTVDSYTMDDSKEIKRRLILCHFFYEILSFDLGYKFNLDHFGKIYIIDERGQEMETIEAKDYNSSSVLRKRAEGDLEILSLLNN